MTYADIAKVNSEIKTLPLKGKDYAMVAERITAFRKLYPDGVITTDIISNEAGVVMMKATVGYYREDQSIAVLGTGYAREEQGKGMVNGTSHIENCETSAVGRALGFLGLGLNGGGICSAEELVNAITAQKQKEEENQAKQAKQSKGKPMKAQVVKAEPQPEQKPQKPEQKPEVKQEEKPVPEQKPEAQPVIAFLKTAIATIRDSFGIGNAEVSEAWKQLMQDGVVPFKSSADYTFDEAERLVNALNDWFSNKK